MLINTVFDCIFSFCIEFADTVYGIRVTSIDIVESSTSLGMLNNLVLVLQSGFV